MKTFNYFFLFISILFFSSFSISDSDIIDGNNLNQEKLEALILKEVNAVRRKKRKPILILDSILNLAATDHAVYLKSAKKLSHNQKSKSKKTPMKRTDFYGGKFRFVGENIAYSYLQKDVNSAKRGGKVVYMSTYSKTAKHLFNLWYNSKPHFKNIMEKGFKKTSIRFSYDKKTNRIYAVQVFAS
ncbi:MAG: CAP domain-containing protein [Flavobacteriales bacterium]